MRRYRITISLAATLSALTTALGGIELLLPCAIAKGDCCVRERWCVLREIELVEGVCVCRMGAALVETRSKAKIRPTRPARRWFCISDQP